jgi:hypothetical protein
MKARLTARLVWAFVLYNSLAANAQGLPTDPVSFVDGAVTIGGSISGSIAPKDNGFYNYTDYTYSSLRSIRGALTGRVRTGEHVSFLSELRMQNGSPPDLYALYMRVKPWVDRDVDVQIGRVPPTFGAFPSRAYTADNLLIGYPLGYQYLTSLRPDSLPASADDLLAMRGRGWLARFPVGDVVAHHGVAPSTAFRWDTGVRLHAATDLLEATGAVTVGTISNPLVRDDNDALQLVGRLVARPLAGLVLGGSMSHGTFVTTEAAAASGTLDGRELAQDAWGADVEYSWGYYLIRAEAIVSRWTLPVIAAPFIEQPLESESISVEGRYRIMPGLYAAARADYLGFSDVTGTHGTMPWDAPVSRLEVGGGYSLQRNLLLKVTYQYNRRDDTRTPRAHFIAAEVMFWL